eukprot:Gb_08775 [translate_table: standard]
MHSSTRTGIILDEGQSRTRDYREHYTHILRPSLLRYIEIDTYIVVVFAFGEVRNIPMVLKPSIGLSRLPTAIAASIPLRRRPHFALYSLLQFNSKGVRHFALYSLFPSNFHRRRHPFYLLLPIYFDFTIQTVN